MESGSEPSLSFTLIDDDVAAPGFVVEAHGSGFSGVTEIWLTRSGVDAFLEALDGLDASLKGEARLRAGWVEVGEAPSDERADLLVTIRPWGHAGQLEVDVNMRASASIGGRNAARVWFVIPEPSALTRFRRTLRTLTDGNGDSPAILTAAIARTDI